MFDRLIQSSLIHSLFILGLYYYPAHVNTSKIDVEIIEKAPLNTKKEKTSVTRNYANRGPRQGAVEKGSGFDPKTYGEKLKAIVDPVFIQKVRYSGLQNLTATVLFYPNKNGGITNLKLTESSGNSTFDNLCLETLKNITNLPSPSDSLISEGIIWTFTD